MLLARGLPLPADLWQGLPCTTGSWCRSTSCPCIGSGEIFQFPAGHMGHRQRACGKRLCALESLDRFHRQSLSRLLLSDLSVRVRFCHNLQQASVRLFARRLHSLQSLHSCDHRHPFLIHASLPVSRCRPGNPAVEVAVLPCLVVLCTVLAHISP